MPSAGTTMRIRRLALLTALLLGSVVNAAPWPAPVPPPSLPGKFVLFDDMDKCPRLKRRAIPESVHDVRPDDFTVVMAIGDSITAGFLAQDAQDTTSDGTVRVQAVLSTPQTLSLDMEEFRGVSYAIGGDDDAITLPRILGHYTNATGASTGHHLPVTCAGVPRLPASRVCTSHPESDKLNGAISGAVSAGLEAQVRDYLVPQYEALEKREGWAYLNLAIGANDICAFCVSGSLPIGFVGTPEEFAQGIKNAVEVLRNHVPKLIVNIIGLFRVSAVYALTKDDPYCTHGLPLPRLPLECSCAMLPGFTGQYTRYKMDELSDAYDQAVLDLVAEWNAQDDDSFGVIWQPGEAIDLANYPIQAVSALDCFHPSEAAHQRLAAGVWNRLTMSPPLKAIPINWEKDVYVRCLEESDRIRIH